MVSLREMVNPLRVLTSSYDLICTNLGCDQRQRLPTLVRAHAAALTLARIGFLMLCSGFFGASLAVMVHAQTSVIGERTARLEMASVTASAQIARLEDAVAHLQSQVATMSGIGMGLATALSLLQIAQMILGRKPG
jgi:hypothetical protein